MAIQRISQLTLITLLTTVGVIVSPIQVIESFNVSLTKGLAQTTENPKTEADKLYEQGDKQFAQNQVEAAIKSWEEALRLYRQDEDKRGKNNTLRRLRDAFDNLGNAAYRPPTINYQQAIEYYEKSLAIDQEICNKSGVASSYNKLGIVYIALREYHRGIELLNKALDIAKEIGDISTITTSYNYLGLAYDNLGQYRESKNYYLQAIEIYENLRKDLPDPNQISLFEAQVETYNRLQEVYIKQNQFDKALVIAERGRYQALIDVLKAKFPSSPSTFSKEEIKTIATQKNATLVEYSIVKNSLYIWVVKPTGDILFKQVDLTNLNQVLPDLNEENLTLSELINRKEDGFLTAREIFNMKLNAQLVVLSGCETGRGPITGEGVIGLSRSLVAAGVQSLIVSLWNVDDEVTGLLMSEFYNQWDKTGNKAQALRQAMLTTMKTHPDPRYWAGFTLIGEDE